MINILEEVGRCVMIIGGIPNLLEKYNNFLYVSNRNLL